MDSPLSLHTAPAAPGGRGSALRRLLLCGGIGAALFLLLYGPAPLNVTGDLWLLNGYVELDATQHYAGWMAFRQAPWQLPLGGFDNLGGGLVTFTDSIPWAAILCKALSPLLPATFQYFGLYIFLCLVLQGVSAGLLLGQFTSRPLALYGGCALFCLSPILLERAFRHCALASHYLILFALYLLFASRASGRMSWGYLPLSLLAIGIHPYFLPMVYAIMAANLLCLLPHGPRTAARALLQMGLSMALTIAAGYLIGALGTSVLTGDGYGFYCMNLNALFNSLSCSKIHWSRFLPVPPMILGNYDAFNYLGLGVLLALPALLWTLLRRGRELLARYWGLAVVCLALTLFAVSCTVTFQDKVLLEIPLPEPLFQFASIFRSSGRLFYPVNYLLLLGVVVALDRLPHRQALLALLAALQLLDLSPALAVKHQSFQPETVQAACAQNPWLAGPASDAIPETVRQVKTLHYIFDYRFAAWGLKNGMELDVHITNRARRQSAGEADPYQAALAELTAGGGGPEVAYATNRADLAQQLAGSLGGTHTLLTVGDCYFFVDNASAP